MSDDECKGEFYEVLYNACYGGFDFPEDFITEVFAAYPPNTEEGAELFRKEGYITVLKEGETPPSDCTHYYRQVRDEPFTNGYRHVYFKSVTKKIISSSPPVHGEFEESNREIKGYVTNNDKDYYYLSCNPWGWRDKPCVVRLAKEKDIIGKKIDHSLLKIKKIPVGWGFHVDEYDGKESVEKYFPLRKALEELVDFYKNRNESVFTPMTKKLLDGTIPLGEAV